MKDHKGKGGKATIKTADKALTGMKNLNSGNWQHENPTTGRGTDSGPKK